MIICYSGNSAPSAFRLAEQDDSIVLNRGTHGDINWGRAYAETRLNPDTSKAANKRVMRQLFAEHDVPMPRLIGLVDIIRDFQHGQVVVGRPDRHTKGRGFWLCRDGAEVMRACEGTRRKQAATHFMEYVEAPREYRVHVFQGKSIRISEKSYTDPANKRAGYTTAKPRHEVAHVRAAAKKALEAVGLDFGAVDVLADDINCWVLEVNSAPGLGGSMPQLYVATFKRYMEEQCEG